MSSPLMESFFEAAKLDKNDTLIDHGLGYYQSYCAYAFENWIKEDPKKYYDNEKVKTCHTYYSL